MVEELKSEARKLEHLIGFKGKKDVTSRAFTKEMIRALEDKYKIDLGSSIRLRRLEFYRDLIENARHKHRNREDIEVSLLLNEKKKRAKQRGGEDEDEENVESKVEEEEDQAVRLEDEMVLKTEDIDEWKNLMTLAKVYYVMEHPNSRGLVWKRRTSKKKTIKKFTDKDLIEWYVAQHFRLKSLEEWAVSREQARKLAEESPYDFDDLSEDEESRELEDMFNLMESQKQKKHTISRLEKALYSRRPFRIKDECIEDWTESYSDDSEEPGAEHIFDGHLDINEEPDMRVEGFEQLSEEDPHEEDMTNLFSMYKETPKYRNPAFDTMDVLEKIEDWYDLCDHTMGVVSPPSEEDEEPARKVTFFGEVQERELYVIPEDPSLQSFETDELYFSNVYDEDSSTSVDQIGEDQRVVEAARELMRNLKEQLKVVCFDIDGEGLTQGEEKVEEVVEETEVIEEVVDESPVEVKEKREENIEELKEEIKENVEGAKEETEENGEEAKEEIAENIEEVKEEIEENVEEVKEAVEENVEEMKEEIEENVEEVKEEIEENVEEVNEEIEEDVEEVEEEIEENVEEVKEEIEENVEEVKEEIEENVEEVKEEIEENVEEK